MSCAGSAADGSSGGADGWPEKEFGAFGPYNTIPIDGTAHARIDSGDYYLVEIEGYVLRYDGSEWAKDEKPYYKTKHTIIGGDNSGATVDRAYVFYVDVVETFSITYTDGLDEDLFADQVYDGLFPGDETPAFAGECRRDGYVFYGWTPAVADTVSGDITLSGSIGTLRSCTISGDVEISGSVREARCSSASGDVLLKTGVLPEFLELSSKSGDCEARLPDQGGFALQYSTVSGDLYSDFPLDEDTSGKSGSVTYLDGGESSFRLSSVSGDITLRKI